MDTHYYVVRVQDYGEVYEYKFSALEALQAQVDALTGADSGT